MGSVKVVILPLVFFGFTTKSTGLSECEDWYLLSILENQSLSYRILIFPNSLN